MQVQLLKALFWNSFFLLRYNIFGEKLEMPRRKESPIEDLQMKVAGAKKKRKHRRRSRSHRSRSRHHSRSLLDRLEDYDLGPRARFFPMRSARLSYSPFAPFHLPTNLGMNYFNAQVPQSLVNDKEAMARYIRDQLGSKLNSGPINVYAPGMAFRHINDPIVSATPSAPASASAPESHGSISSLIGGSSGSESQE